MPFVPTWMDLEVFMLSEVSQTEKDKYADNTTLMAESEEELISLLMKVKEESEKFGLISTLRKLRSWHMVPSLHGK